jgi:hypothetical protein
LHGLDHLGFQVDSTDELRQLTQRLEGADLAVLNQGETTCCYAQSDKGWVHDPQGVAWETFYTRGEATTYGTKTADASAQPSACCAPTLAAVAVPETTKTVSQGCGAVSCGV